MSIYLKTAQAKGNVTIPQFKEAIEIHDIEYSGMTTPTKMRVGQTMDRNHGFPTIGQITFLKSQDSSSNTFFEAAHSGMVFNQLEFNYVSEGKDPTTYGKLILQHAMITHFSEKHSHALPCPIERISVAYTQIQKTTVPIDSAGKMGSPNSTGYDIEKAKKM